MIEREKILALLGVSEQHGATVEMTPSELAELCRVYIAWMEAPEVTVLPDAVTGDDDGAIWLEPEMIGKRVRLVEVKDG